MVGKHVGHPYDLMWHLVFIIFLQLLPEYQVAHERAVYKTVAIVADTKKIVQNINLESLAELRAMQKPSIEIEDLMAAIIMIRECDL